VTSKIKSHLKNLWTIVLWGLAVIAWAAPPAHAMKPTAAYRLSMENDAKLIESVAAHLSGVAQLQRVVVKKLDWNSPSNRELKYVQAAIKDFKNSQVLLSEAMNNTDVLMKNLDEKRRKKLEAQVQGLHDRTGDLSAKNAAVIKTLESQELPSTETLHELTTSMLAVIGYGIDISKKNNKVK
jgi:hypothetical protein